jgi:hypothetical protein
MFAPIVSTIFAPFQPQINVIKMGLTHIQYGRRLVERAEGPSGMAKGTIIVLVGFGIIAAAIFIALRSAGSKIQSEMNAGY